MEYTIKKLGELAGISTRTLRYYDQINLLKPVRVSSAGYRIYGQQEVDQLQQILFYKELGVSLEKIKEIISEPNFDRSQALREHRERLIEKRRQLHLLITNVDKTIASNEGRVIMMDKEKFVGFKEKAIKENEEKYGAEIRKKYGNDTVDGSNQKLKNMTQEDFERVTKLEQELIETLAEAFKTGDPASELAQRAADLHRQWISFYWPQYSKEAHAGLAQMYVDDERFTAYYDVKTPGTAVFLRDAILIYTGMSVE